MNAESGNHFAHRRHAGVMVAALAATLAGACASSSSLVNLWKDPQQPTQPMRKVLVIAVKKDPLTRRIWEDVFTSELGRRGVEATPSYRAFPDATPDTEQVIQEVTTHAQDGVFVVHKLGTETGQRFVPGYVTTEPVLRYNRWANAYYTYYREVREPGYTETEKIVHYQVDVWSTQGERGALVWSGTTQSIDPTSSREASQEISRLIAPELARSGVIPK